MKKRLLIMGNAPLSRRLGQEIDSADCVMRFNEPSQDVAHIGSKTDLLVLATSSKAMGRWLSEPKYLNSAIVQNTPEILCAVHPAIIRRYHPQPNLLSRLKGRRADWTSQVIEVFGQMGKKVSVLPVQHYQAACDSLALPEAARSQIFPSNGYLGTWWAIRQYPSEDWQLQICGFKWQGWKRHPWGAEKSWFERQIAAGRLTVLD